MEPERWKAQRFVKGLSFAEVGHLYNTCFGAVCGRFIKWVVLVRLLGRLYPSTLRRHSSTATGLPSTSDAEDAVESRLITILHLVNGWLQYAEAKNGGLVALSAVGVTGILTYLASAPDASALLIVGLLVTGLLLIASLVIALLSFIPRVDPTKIKAKTTIPLEGKDNFYFYGDLQKYQPEQLAKAIARNYHGIEDYNVANHRSHTDIASQIIINSRIASSKNKYFRVAISFTLMALVSGVAFAILTVLFC